MAIVDFVNIRRILGGRGDVLVGDNRNLASVGLHSIQILFMSYSGVRYLHSEPRLRLNASMQKLNLKTHSLVIELLQAIVSRGELNQATVESIEDAIISKLFLLVHSEKLELQNKLLHLLHSVVSSSASLASRQATSDEMPPQNATELSVAIIDGAVHPDQSSTPVTSSLFIQLLVDGIAVPSNRPLLHHWLDFILMTVPQFPHILTYTITPLNVCVCRQLRNSLSDISAVCLGKGGMNLDLRSHVDDAELSMLLNALERLVLIALDEADSGFQEEISPTDRSTSDGTGLLSMVSNVFLTESQSQSNEPLMTVSHYIP